MYERVVRIIVLLRTQNNYIALLSGMTALSDVWMGRLRVTKALAQEALERAGDTAVLKKFQSHGRLVDNRQNYKTYRLAVREDEAAKRPAIPLVPVILADVNRAAQIEGVRKTDGAIVWSKYDKLGSILLAMTEYQSRGCPVGPVVGPNAVEVMLRDKPDIEERVRIVPLDEAGFAVVTELTMLFSLRHRPRRSFTADVTSSPPRSKTPTPSRPPSASTSAITTERTAAFSPFLLYNLAGRPLTTSLEAARRLGLPSRMTPLHRMIAAAPAEKLDASQA